MADTDTPAAARAAARGDAQGDAQRGQMLRVDSEGRMLDSKRASREACSKTWSAVLSTAVACGLAATAVDSAVMISHGLAGLLVRIIGGADISIEEMAFSFHTFVRIFVWVLSLLALSSALYTLMDNATLALELQSTLRSESRAWHAGDKVYYKDAKYIDLRLGGKFRNFRRRVVAVERNLPCSEKKPCIFFLHGSMARIGQFGPLMERAKRRGFGVFAFDMFGMGRSKGRYLSMNDGLDAYSSKAFSREELLEDIFLAYEYCREKAGKGTPIIICAHSFGCQLALELVLNIIDPLIFDMQTYPPAGLVLIGSQAPQLESIKRDENDLVWKKQQSTANARALFKLPLSVLRLIRPILSRNFKERAFHPDSLKDTKGSNPERAAHLKNMLTYADALSGANSMSVCKSFYLETLGTAVDAKRIQKHHKKLPPVHLVTGDSDKICPPECGQRMADVLRGKEFEREGHISYTTVKSAGHQCMEEQPDSVFETLLQVVRRALH